MAEVELSTYPHGIMRHQTRHESPLCNPDCKAIRRGENSTIPEREPRIHASPC